MKGALISKGVQPIGILGARWDAAQGANRSDSGVLSRGFATRRGAHIDHPKFQSVVLPYLHSSMIR